ncbi:hypothetical protein GCM10025868_35140 [Angustibacter aerolatus]|uniref:Pyrimidine nucleoside phosphorylase C-terminal domain-containing protein n=1 Tax=Angustibacter aerolatus TaxID=1162965 RepID=A0ABQ6JMB0_9ACTN|nr:hypothetical protein [Angustibacter aerolatus]GMA88264.1 hypothetical protein GCM10025868_35140 [Angustibacter aerolatus]
MRVARGRASRCRRARASSLHAKPGATVRGGDPLMSLHTDEPDRFERALEALQESVFIAPEGSRPDLLPLVIERVAAD